MDRETDVARAAAFKALQDDFRQLEDRVDMVVAAVEALRQMLPANRQDEFAQRVRDVYERGSKAADAAEERVWLGQTRTTDDGHGH